MRRHRRYIRFCPCSLQGQPASVLLVQDIQPVSRSTLRSLPQPWGGTRVHRLHWKVSLRSSDRCRASAPEGADIWERPLLSHRESPRMPATSYCCSLESSGTPQLHQSSSCPECEPFRARRWHSPSALPRPPISK